MKQWLKVLSDNMREFDIDVPELTLEKLASLARKKNTQKKPFGDEGATSNSRKNTSISGNRK